MFFIQLATATAVVAAAAAEASTAAAKNKDNDKDNNPRATSVITVIATHKRTSLPFSNSYYEKEVCCVTTKSDANIFVSDYSAVYTENLTRTYGFSAKKRTADAISLGVPKRPSGTCSASSFLSKHSFIRVSIIPGATQLTVMPDGASS